MYLHSKKNIFANKKIFLFFLLPKLHEYLLPPLCMLFLNRSRAVLKRDLEIGLQTMTARTRMVHAVLKRVLEI
jgi:hypothetical protein